MRLHIEPRVNEKARQKAEIIGTDDGGLVLKINQPLGFKKEVHLKPIKSGENIALHVARGIVYMFYRGIYGIHKAGYKTHFDPNHQLDFGQDGLYHVELQS